MVENTQRHSRAIVLSGSRIPFVEVMKYDLELTDMSSLTWRFCGTLLRPRRVEAIKRWVNCLLCVRPFAAAHIRGLPLHPLYFLLTRHFSLEFFLSFQYNLVGNFLSFCVHFQAIARTEISAIGHRAICEGVFDRTRVFLERFYPSHPSL